MEKKPKEGNRYGRKRGLSVEQATKKLVQQIH